MTKKEIRQIYAELCGEMTSEEFLAASGLQKETVEMLLNREYWETQISAVFPIRKRVTCSSAHFISSASMIYHGARERFVSARYWS